MSKPTITIRDRADAYGIGLRIAEAIEKHRAANCGSITAHETAAIAGEIIAEVRATAYRLGELAGERTTAAREVVTEAVAAIRQSAAMQETEAALRAAHGLRETSLSLPVEYVVADGQVLDASVLGARLPQEAIDQLAPTLLYEARQQDRYADESDRTEAAIDAAIERKEVA